MLDPDTASRLAKVLRLLVGTSFDQEALAARDRLRAIVISADLNWDELLTDGVPVLDQEAAKRVYAAAYERGFEDGKQQARPEWAPAAGDATEIGNDYDKLRLTLDAAAAAAESDLLTEFEEEFTTNMAERVRKYGRSTFISRKQQGVIDRLNQKLARQGFI